jgi:hypothetical protein
MSELMARAVELAGRDIEVEKTKDGKYIVLFMSMTESPPPKGATIDEALEKFIAWAEARPKRELPDEVPVLDDNYNDDTDTGLSEDTMSVREKDIQD